MKAIITLTEEVKELYSQLESSLDQYLEKDKEIPPVLIEAMRYAVMGNGKRLRPMLTLLTATSFGCSLKSAMPTACAIELLHNYSLIHDDLPCMDNDDYRRGKPTVHKAFGEPVAVLSGDALLTIAFKFIVKTPDCKAEILLRVIEEIVDAIGVKGMIGGQILDIEAVDKKDTTLEDLRQIHLMKTGTLIKASVKVGAILAEVDEKTLEKLSLYGEKIGLAFQIIDDILDYYEEEEKITYPSLIGLDQARTAAELATKEAVSALEAMGDKVKPLRDLAWELLNRVI